MCIRDSIDLDASVMRRILGHSRAELEQDPTIADSVVIHRDNLVLADPTGDWTPRQSSRQPPVSVPNPGQEPQEGGATE